MDKLMRNTWVEVNLDAIKNNLKVARNLLNEHTKVAVVVKANAYGHGAIEVAGALIESNVDMLNVACLSEALEIRRHFKEVPILVMGYTPSEQLEEAVKNNITITVFSYNQCNELDRYSKVLNKKSKIHIKVDTGFNRLGFKASEDSIREIKRISSLNNIDIEGIFSHLALVDKNTDYKQFNLFLQFIKRLEEEGINIPLKHISDSIAMVKYPEFQLNMVRPGAFIFGMEPSGSNREKLGLKPALIFKTKVSHIKYIEPGEGVGYDFTFKAKDRSKIATLPVGYADGYFRCLSNIGEVSIKGKRAKIVGKICMDQCMVDLTHIENVQVGDEVVLIGESKENCIPVMELADNANTNRNEVLSIISRRVPRVYYENEMVKKVVDYLLD